MDGGSCGAGLRTRALPRAFAAEALPGRPEACRAGAGGLTDAGR